MMFKFLLLFLNCFVSVSMIPMTVYNNAYFHSIDVRFQLTTLFSISSESTCACQCYNDPMCLTGNFFGFNETCVLFSAQLWQGQLKLMGNGFTSVFTFPNRTTIIYPDNLPTIIEWLFDGNFNDVYDRYNGTLITNDSISWLSPGYAGYGSAVYFSPKSYSLVDHYLNLTTASFTISAWIQMLPNFTSQASKNFALFSHCEQFATDKCLHTVIVYGRLRLGFYGDDLTGNTTLKSNQWYHVAYVYDRSTFQQIVYLNGNLDGSRTPTSSYIGNASRIIIGPIPSMPIVTFLNGYIDKITFVSRVKNATELLDEATLVAYYPFDGSYFDAGPNKIDNIVSISTTFDSAGRSNQALVINSTTSSYFQTTGFYYLGQTNYSYSLSLWIYPFINNGTIIEVSSSNGWCVPMIGFDNTGYLTIQTLSNNGFYSITSTSVILAMNVWTHVSMTYSLTYGIRLFVNGVLVDNNNLSNDYLASGEMVTITVGACLQSNFCAVNQTKIVPSQFRGKIDELKIFSRELSTSEVYQLWTSS